MKKIFKLLAAAFVGIAAASAMSFAAFAEDYEFDVSEAKQTKGSWGQTYIHYTRLGGDAIYAENFDPTWLTSDSEVQIEYEYEGDPPNGYPVELIWQTWEGGPAGQNPDIKGTWNKVVPYEYDDDSAKFSYKDIVDAYGTDDFSTVYAINIGDAGVKLKLTKMTITNVEIPEPEETEASTEKETEKTTVKETEKETTQKTTTVKETEKETSVTTTASIADNAPDDGSTGTIIIMVVVIAVVVAVIVVIIVMMVKKTKGRFY